MLLQHVWNLHFDTTTNIIDVYVGRVRRKVDSQQSYPLIHTIRGVGFVSGLLSKSLRSSTFRVALLCILIFGTVVLALFSYVYLATDAYVLAQSDRAIDADRDDLVGAYHDGGRQGIIDTIDRWQAEKARADALYLLADPSFRRVAGNLPAWPGSLQGPEVVSALRPATVRRGSWIGRRCAPASRPCRTDFICSSAATSATSISS